MRYLVTAWHAVAGWMTGTLYRHYRGGLYRLVRVVPDSTNCRSGRSVVEYVSLRLGEHRARDLAEWSEHLPGEGKRFQPLP